MIKVFDRKKTDTYYTDYEVDLANHGIKWLQYASFWVTEKVFSRVEMDDICRICEKYNDQLEGGSVIGQTSEETYAAGLRDSKVYFMGSDPEFQPYQNKILENIQNINRNVWNLDLTQSMNPQYTVYDQNGHFEWHPDGPFGVQDMRGLNCIPDSMVWRKLSFVLALDDANSYEGGDFQIMTTSTRPDNCISTIRLDRGSSIIFPAFQTHKVTPVTKGTRRTLVFWICGPRWR